MPLTLTRAFALVALIRTLVVAAQRLLEDNPRMRRGDLRNYWIAAENKWLATRYGLAARCIRTPGRKRRELAEDIARLLEQLQPVVRGTGDADILSSLEVEAHTETGAECQRRLYRETGDWRHVIDRMSLRWSKELEEAKNTENASPTH
jgi:carboxylate-amine ligase